MTAPGVGHAVGPDPAWQPSPEMRQFDRLFDERLGWGIAKVSLYFGPILESFGIHPFDPQTVRWYRYWAGQGDAKAQYYLGRLYVFGWVVEKNETEAVRWLRLSAEQGFAKGQMGLGWMYYNGFGVAKDYQEAARWYLLAAEQDDAKAQYNIAQFYLNGWGVPRDYAEAEKWLRLAAAKGYQDAPKALAKLESAKQTEQDRLNATRQRAEQGHRTSQFILGLRYYHGDGVPQSFEEAAKWFRRAAEQEPGDITAQKYLADMYARGWVCRKTTANRCAGGCWRRHAAAAPRSNGKLASSMPLVEACRETTPKRCNGSAGRRPKATSHPSTTLAKCTPLAGAWRGTTPSR